MSWWVSVEAVRAVEAYDRNVTWNDSAILAKALKCEFRDLDGAGSTMRSTYCRGCGMRVRSTRTAWYGYRDGRTIDGAQ